MLHLLSVPFGHGVGSVTTWTRGLVKLTCFPHIVSIFEKKEKKNQDRCLRGEEGGERTVWIEVAHADGRWNDALLQREDGFDDAGYAARGFGVA